MIFILPIGLQKLWQMPVLRANPWQCLLCCSPAVVDLYTCDIQFNTVRLIAVFIICLGFLMLLLPEDWDQCLIQLSTKLRKRDEPAEGAAEAGNSSGLNWNRRNRTSMSTFTHWPLIPQRHLSFSPKFLLWEDWHLTTALARRDVQANWIGFLLLLPGVVIKLCLTCLRIGAFCQAVKPINQGNLMVGDWRGVEAIINSNAKKHSRFLCLVWSPFVLSITTWSCVAWANVNVECYLLDAHHKAILIEVYLSQNFMPPTLYNAV